MPAESLPGGNLEYLLHAPVEHDEPLIGIEHTKALRHVRQRRVEALVLRRQRAFGLVEYAEYAVEHAQRQRADGEIGSDGEEKARQGDRKRGEQHRPQARGNFKRARDVAVDDDRRAAGDDRRHEGSVHFGNQAAAVVVHGLAQRLFALSRQP